jgi:hypothetical protein
MFYIIIMVIKNYIDDLKQIIKDIDDLINNLTNNKIKYYREKEKKHRPLNKNNDTRNIIEPINISFDNFNKINIGILSNKKINNEKYEDKIKVNNKTIYKYTNELEIKFNKQLGLSLYPITYEEEINRIIEGYKEEREQYNILLKNIISNKEYKHIYKYIIDYKNIYNRIFIINNKNEIKKYFNENIDYEFVILFTPPEKDLSMYSIYYYKNKCYIANSYIFVKNRKNEFHLFYGYINKIDKKYEVKNEDEIINYLFKKHIIQNNNKFLFIKNIKLQFDDYKETNEYNEYLSVNFCKFLKLYLSSIIPHDKININPINQMDNILLLYFDNNIDKFLKQKNKNINIKGNEIGINIEIILDILYCYIDNKSESNIIDIHHDININCIINTFNLNENNLFIKLKYDNINKKYILCFIIIKEYDNIKIKNKILELYNKITLIFNKKIE